MAYRRLRGRNGLPEERLGLASSALGYYRALAGWRTGGSEGTPLGEARHARLTDPACAFRELPASPHVRSSRTATSCENHCEAPTCA
jgi:hypothetical protein